MGKKWLMKLIICNAIALIPPHHEQLLLWLNSKVIWDSKILITMLFICFYAQNNIQSLVCSLFKHKIRGFRKLLIPAVKVFNTGQVHRTHSHKQDKQMRRLRLGKGWVDARGETGYEWRKRRSGWGCGRKQVKSNRGGKIEWVIANGCYFYCRRAPRHSGGSEDTVYFCANLHSKVPLEVFLYHIFALPPMRGLLFHFLFSSHIPGIPTHLFLILITPSFAIILQQDEGPRD